MRQRLVVTLMLTSGAISGCVAYVPTTLELAPRAGTVRLSLSGDARNQSFGVLGSQIESIEGRVRSIADSGIMISAEAVSRTDEDDQRFRGETVLIPSHYVLSVSRKHTQVARSIILAGLITGGVIWIGTSLGGGSVGYNKVPTPQPGQN